MTEIIRRVDTATLESADDARDVADTHCAELVLTTDHPIVTESFARYPALGRFVLEVDGTVAGAGIIP